MKKEQFLYVGIKGRVLALDRTTGQIIWEARMKGGQMVSLLVDGDHVYASAAGEIFAFDAATGAQLWHNPLPGMGTNLAGLATAGGSSSSQLQQTLLRQQQDNG